MGSRGGIGLLGQGLWAWDLGTPKVQGGVLTVFANLFYELHSF